jgi:hypothetical protein
MERERLVEDACLPCPVAHVSSARLFRLAPARAPTFFDPLGVAMAAAAYS